MADLLLTGSFYCRGAYWDTRDRARDEAVCKASLFYFLFYFRVHLEHPSVITSTDTKTPDLPMKNRQCCLMAFNRMKSVIPEF